MRGYMITLICVVVFLSCRLVITHTSRHRIKTLLKKSLMVTINLTKDQDGKETKTDLTCPSDLDWTDLEEFEKQDNTNGNRELACSADACEVVDIVSVA